ncbi:hypothetical protein HD806DRAFT_540364 [Xylariaceae sp. AK1471]|nr:hypothetical protein HD806DRAFT_540364 [Xylariaceae sp. AK1471]
MHSLPSLVLPAALLNLLLPSSVFLVSATPDRSICVRQNALMLAEAADCGDRNSLRDCFLSASNFVTLNDLEGCFINADCTIAEAALEAMVILKNCDQSSTAPELRRRGPEAMPEPTPKPAPQDNNTPQSTSPATATTGAFARPSVCSTARMIHTTVCPMVSLGPKHFSKLPCTSTTLTSMECAATNYCFDNGHCIFRDDHIYAGGLVATIALAVAIVTTVAVFLVFYIREKKKHRLARLEAEKEEAEQKLKAAHTRTIERVEEAKMHREQDEAEIQAKIQASDHKHSLESRAYMNPFADGRG